MNIRIKNSLYALEALIARTEGILISLWMLVLVTVGSLQVTLRNFFDTGLDLGDLLARSLVLWVGFTGASLATRKGRHINIEIISKLVTYRGFSSFRLCFVNFISLLISLLLLKASLDFIFLEAQNNIIAFLNVPTWVVFVVVPTSLFVMSIRLLIHFIINKNLEEDVQ